MYSISIFNKLKSATLLVLSFFFFSSVHAQTKQNSLKEFSEESLILGEWELVRVEQNSNSTFLRKGFVKSTELQDVSLKVSESSLFKKDNEGSHKFSYTIDKDSLLTLLILQSDGASYSYELLEINHFSFTIISEVKNQKGLDYSLEKIYYTYLRKGWDNSELKKIIGTWSICSDSVIDRFSIDNCGVYSFQKQKDAKCNASCNASLEISRSNFQYLHNVKEEDAKSFIFISSTVLVNMEKRLVYLNMEKGLVYNILHLDENNLVLQLNRELSEKLL